MRMRGAAGVLLLTASAAAAAASCNYTAFPDDNFDGHNLPGDNPRTASTADECFAFCCATPGCLFFTLNAGAGPRDCYLKDQMTHRANPGAVSGVVNGSTPPGPPAPASSGWLDAVADCGCDSTGATDTTALLQACVDRAYGHSLPRVPVVLPPGRYLVSDTIVLQQDNPGPDDGINVVPGRFLAHNLIGRPVSATGAARPVLVLAPSSPGFGGGGGGGGGGDGGRREAAPYKAVVNIFSDGGEGVDMNNVFKGIDLDLTAAGNAGACGVMNGGAQGAAVTDVDVSAAGDTFACFCGLNGAGGLHANIKCDGARYGLFIDQSQPVPSGVGAVLTNQAVSAVVMNAQESLSLVGVSITTPAFASGPAIAQVGDSGVSLVDVSITCASANQTAVQSTRSLFFRDVFVAGCGTAIAQSGATTVPGPAPGGAWLHLASYARGVDRSEWYVANVVTVAGVRHPNGTVLETDDVAPPADLISKHLWDEATFPDFGAPGVLDARRDCGAKGDNFTDDTAALQACFARGLGRVFLPPGLFRISDTLVVPAGGALVGMGNTASILLAATAGFPRASPAAPLPMLRTSTGAATIAHVGVVTWQHLASVTTLEWLSQDAGSVWRLNFESRDCECLWLSAYQAPQGPFPVPCSMPVNLTLAKSVFSGLGRVYGFVNDDTGAIISTGASYRSLLVDGSAGTAAGARLRFYSLNLEHAQSEANGEIRNSSFVDVMSVKAEGNSVILWVRADTSNVSIMGFGGDPTAFPYNFSYPPDFVQLSPSLLRVEAGARGATLALLLDHGSGASPPYWPPGGGRCHWKREYSYPGESIPYYPFWTYPNASAETKPAPPHRHPLTPALPRRQTADRMHSLPTDDSITAQVTMWNCWVRALPALERRGADLQPRGADLQRGHLLSPPSPPARPFPRAANSSASSVQRPTTGRCPTDWARVASTAPSSTNPSSIRRREFLICPLRFNERSPPPLRERHRFLLATLFYDSPAPPPPGAALRCSARRSLSRSRSASLASLIPCAAALRKKLSARAASRSTPSSPSSSIRPTWYWASAWPFSAACIKLASAARASRATPRPSSSSVPTLVRPLTSPCLAERSHHAKPCRSSRGTPSPCASNTPSEFCANEKPSSAARRKCAAAARVSRGPPRPSAAA